jgi:DEAD/DEAH box helicase domain-containing protein
VRQYLGYCFDSATHAGILKELPRTGGQLVSDLNHPNGHIPTVLQWLHDRRRAAAVLPGTLPGRHQSDTRRRFLDDTTADRLGQRIHQVANDFDRTRRELVNARARLQDQLNLSPRWNRRLAATSSRSCISC